MLPPCRSLAQNRIPVVGILRVNQRDRNETFAEPFRRNLRELGHVEGSTVELLFRWAESRAAALPALAAELAARNVDVIVTFGSPGTRAAQRATATIPIVAMAD